MSDDDNDRSVRRRDATEPRPVPFRPGLRALTSVAFAGALYFSILSFILARKLQVHIWQTWTPYAAIGLAVLGVLFYWLAYRRPNGGAG